MNGIPTTDWELDQGEPRTAVRTAVRRSQGVSPLEKSSSWGLDRYRTSDRSSKGAKHVDAVDIDPRILEIGAERNPNHPYQDPRVTRYVDDGRAFLSSHSTRYDLILFALPDSLALVNGASQIRLRKLLVHRGGADGGTEPPDAERDVRDV